MSIDKFENRLKSKICQDAAGLAELFVDCEIWREQTNIYDEFSEYWTKLNDGYAVVDNLYAIELVANRSGKSLKIHRASGDSWGMLWLEDKV